jgi:predicted patatin/cPLA2 family phospholipase
MLTLLALSGGSDGGAYGAGFLYGWTETGKRPEFDMVTGISTGALMSPFAFLGPESDEPLKAVYTTISAKNIYNVRSLGQMITNRDAVAESTPLAQLLKKYVTAETIKKIGMEHKKGRRLYVGTTHLDSGRLVVWDMGVIALSKHPDAPDLFRSILLASASIPMAFPPVYISIEEGGSSYDEMHVDGGLINQVFGVEALVHVLRQKQTTGSRIKARVFMIRNSEITIPPRKISRKLRDIGSRTVEVMINSQSIGDILRNFILARQAGVDFFLTGIPKEFKAPHSEPFNTEYMNKLFQVGVETGTGKNPWEFQPPGLRGVLSPE